MMMEKLPEGPERRRYVRVKRNFILTYHLKDNPKHVFEITQLKNISMGGMCFITTRSFPQGTKLAIELKTPYIADKTHLEGTVLQSHERIAEILYETRLEFDPLNPQAEFIITKITELYDKNPGVNNC